MLTLKGLRGLDGASRFPLAKPDLTIKGNAAGHNVDVVVLCVLVAHGHPRRVGQVEPHALHEIGGHGLPLLAIDMFARW